MVNYLVRTLKHQTTTVMHYSQIKNTVMKTARGTTLDLSKPAKSNICMVLTESGRQVMDSLKLTGNQTIVEMFMEKVSMVEVVTSYGDTTEICEDFIWQ